MKKKTKNKLIDLSSRELLNINGGGLWDSIWRWVGGKVVRIGMGHMPSKEQMEDGGYWDYYNPNDPLN